MIDGAAGYVTEVGYTHGYYAELNPLRVAPALLNAGLVPPGIESACELGFGQGLSLNLHACAGATHWSGTDINPGQAGLAQELARCAGSSCLLVDQSFEKFCARVDLPEFDFIGLHGIWSWISDENRRVIVDFVDRKLRVGGVLYVSYNTLPGWASMVPVRELLVEHAGVLGAEGAGIVGRIDGALDFAGRLLEASPRFVRANPQVAERMKRIREQDRRYLAHEYFNRDWVPMGFARMAEWLRPARLDWACSANWLDAVDGINLTTGQQTLLRSIPDALFRQTVRDFCVDQHFRRDYWIKGARALTALEQGERLRRLRFVLTRRRDEVELKASGALGSVTLQQEIYGPLLDALSDHSPRSLGQLERELQGAGVGSAQLLQAVTVLGGTGILQPAHEDDVVAQARERTDRMNAHLMHKARSSAEIGYLVSPVTGGGIAVPRLHQLFLLARQSGHGKPQDWARFVWHLMALQGERLLEADGPLETAERNIAELTLRAQDFADRRLPVLQALKIASAG
ncbi:MAG: hypothetical protein RIS35_976 [Pseudomonadota bacterium]